VKLVLLGAGLLATLYVGSKAPREQHVRLVLGTSAASVRRVDLAYAAEGGEVVRETRFAFEEGHAPRVVPHEPELADGDYRLRIEVDTTGGRRSIERRVTLGGGTTQVDLGDALAAPRQNEPRTAP